MKGHHRHAREAGFRGKHFFRHGGLRLLLLQLIAESPRHGYELIKDIEQRLGGSYSPSPGIVYPTLTLLEEQGHTTVDSSEGGRKRYAVTASGLRHLQDNQAAIDELLARLEQPDSGRPPQVVRALENFKLAVRMRLSRTPLTEEQADAIADVLDDAAKAIERIR